MNHTKSQRLASVIAEAQRNAEAIPQVTRTRELTVADAYEVQHLLRREPGLSGRPTGLKLGLTSLAKARQMGVAEVILGFLTEDMALADGDELATDRLIHPRVEPELAFLIGADLDVHSTDDPFRSVVAVAPALEVIDSRYADFRFTLPDVVADNTSAARYVLGSWTPIGQCLNLTNRGVLLEVNGQAVEAGSTSGILGNPYRAVTAATRIARKYGFEFHAGDVLLAGAATAATPLPPRGFVQARISQLGTVSLTLKDT